MTPEAKAAAEKVVATWLREGPVASRPYTERVQPLCESIASAIDAASERLRADNERLRAIVELLPKQIADDLFVNGSGDKADRLMLVDENNRDLGGWCHQAVVDRAAALARAGGGE